MQRGACLPDNPVHPRLRRQGVARDRDIDVTGEWPFGDEAEPILGVALPVTAMEEQQGQGASVVRGEQIEAGARRIAIDQIEMIRHAGAERFATPQPIGEIMVAMYHGGRVVVSGVERLLIHGAINNHSVPRKYSKWYITQVCRFLCIRLRQQGAAATPGWRTRSVAASPACRDV